MCVCLLFLYTNSQQFVAVLKDAVTLQQPISLSVYCVSGLFHFINILYVKVCRGKRLWLEFPMKFPSMEFVRAVCITVSFVSS